MSKTLAVAIALMISFSAHAQAPPRAQGAKPTPKLSNKRAKPANTVPLAGIVEAVELVVDAYNSRPETQQPNPTLPPLKTADFDFKTAVDIKGGVSVNFLIFKIGVTHDKQTTNDVTFQYIPQPLPNTPHGHLAVPPPLDLKDALSKAIESAANQIKGEKADDKSPLPLQLKSLAVTLAFAVTNDYNGGLNIPIQMVTLGGTGDVNVNNTQSVKLTFSFPDAASDKNVSGN